MTTSAATAAQPSLLLQGLDGTNPLGFLAALGLFRVIDESLDPRQVRMCWSSHGGTWVPALLGPELDQESLLALLASQLAADINRHPVRILESLGEEEPSKRYELFREHADDAGASRRMDADWLAALASDIVPPSAINQLQTTRRDYHYGNLTSVISKTTAEHLRRAIFLPWDYADPLDNQSMHLEPSEDRRHAHQWNKPAGDPDRKVSGGMLGANRLAIEAFALFTSLPNGESLRTIGFTGQRSYNTRWTWPIWDVPLTCPVVRSLMVASELQGDDVSAEGRERLHLKGVIAAYRTSRILVGKTPNFTPAQRIA